MTQILGCTLYYSMTGERFNIYDRHTDPNLTRTRAWIEFLSAEGNGVPSPDIAAGTFPQVGTFTRLQVLNTVEGGPFYTCDTECIIVNGKNQLLKLGHHYRLGINLYRDRYDPAQFSVIFKNRIFDAVPEWVSF